MDLIAHRGIHSDTVGENSREAIAACVDSSADGIEIDVRITADGVCVVHHDTRVKTGARLSRLSFDELAHHDVNIVRVDEALELLRPFQGLINLEVKHLLGERDRFRGLACVAQLSEDVRRVYSSEAEHDRVLVSSFSLPNVKESSHEMPHIARAYLAPRSLPFSRVIARATRYGCTGIHVAVAQMNARRFSDFVKKCHDRNFAVRVYTVNSARDRDYAEALDVDAIFTDGIEAMRA